MRPYEPGDEYALTEIFEACFGTPHTVEDWLWRWCRVPNGALSKVLVCNGRPVGHRGYARFPVSVRGRRLYLVHGAYLMILPELQGRGGVPLLLQSLHDSAHDFDVFLGFPNDRAAPLLQRYGEGRLLGRLPQWIRWQTRVPRLPRPAGRAVAAGLRLRGALGRLPRTGLTLEPLAEPGDEVDRLAEESTAFAPCIRIRDARYLRWRWIDQPGEKWAIRAARDAGGDLRGLVVFGREGQPSERLGRIVDILATDGAALRALVYGALDELVAAGCRKVTCDYLDPRPWARRVLYRAGFVPRPGTNVVCGALSGRAELLPERLDAWYLTRGDTDVS